jgi:ATP-dependent helicase/nuclease subunit A
LVGFLAGLSHEYPSRCSCPQAELLDVLIQGATLTVVGDENQSIYGFRRADVEVFRRFRERILSEGGEVVLATSFRGHSELVGVLNSVFSSVLGETRQDLEAHRGEPPHEAPHVRLYAVESEGRVPKAQLQRAEAAHIARQLREMLDQGAGVYDAARSESRPVQPGDIVILSRVWAPLEIYGDALAAAGIPSVHAGAGNGVLPQDRSRPSSVFEPGWNNRPWPPKEQYSRNSQNARA